MPVDILLLYPNNRVRAYGALGESIAGVTPPLQVGLLAAFSLKEDLSVAVLDADAENLSVSDTSLRVVAANPVAICMATDSLNSGDVTKMAAASETLAAIKQHSPEIPVILEGVVPSAFPERILREEKPDYVCQGEPYVPVTRLVKVLKAGKKPVAGEIRGLWFFQGGDVASAEREPLMDSNEFPSIPWHLFPMDRYRAHHWQCFENLKSRHPYACIYTNLGCPHSCSFCNVNAVFGKPNLRMRAPERVIDDIEELVQRYKVRNIRIIDNIFPVKPDFVEEICDRIIQKRFDLNLWAYARVENMQDAGLLKKMRRAGIRWICYGIEAGAQQVRTNVRKGSAERIIDRAVELTRSAGIHIIGNYIFGLPGDNEKTMRQTMEAAKRYNTEWANFYCAMAYPGTALHAEALRNGTPLPDRWDGYGQYSETFLPLPTETLTPAEILRFRDNAFREYFDRPDYQNRIQRLFGDDAVSFVIEILRHRLPRKLLAAQTRTAPPS